MLVSACRVRLSGPVRQARILPCAFARSRVAARGAPVRVFSSKKDKDDPRVIKDKDGQRVFQYESPDLERALKEARKAADKPRDKEKMPRPDVETNVFVNNPFRQPALPEESQRKRDERAQAAHAADKAYKEHLAPLEAARQKAEEEAKAAEAEAKHSAEGESSTGHSEHSQRGSAGASGAGQTAAGGAGGGGQVPPTQETTAAAPDDGQEPPYEPDPLSVKERVVKSFGKDDPSRMSPSERRMFEQARAGDNFSTAAKYRKDGDRFTPQEWAMLQNNKYSFRRDEVYGLTPEYRPHPDEDRWGGHASESIIERYRWVGIGVAFLLAGIAFTLFLWQLKRRKNKQDMMLSRQQQLSREPVSVSQALADTEVSPVYRTVRLRCKLDYSRDMLVGPRPPPRGTADSVSLKGHGYYVITPALLEDGTQVLINRGWIPLRAEGQVGATLDTPASQAGWIELTGVIRDGEARPEFLLESPDYIPTNFKKKFVFLDSIEMYKQCNIPPFRKWENQHRPFIIDVTDPPLTPYPVRRNPTDFHQFSITPETHAIYAGTWFSLGCLILMLTAVRFKVANRQPQIILNNIRNFRRKVEGLNQEERAKYQINDAAIDTLKVLEASALRDAQKQIRTPWPFGTYRWWRFWDRKPVPGMLPRSPHKPR